MEIPSLIVIVPNIWGMALACRIAASACNAKSLIPALQGVMVLYALAIPTIGLAKSSSVNPTARNMARFGERWTPAVIT